MKGYLFLLLENGLLCYGKGTGIYKTTEKGLTMLAVYNDINKLISQNAGRRKRSVFFQKE